MATKKGGQGKGSDSEQASGAPGETMMTPEGEAPVGDVKIEALTALAQMDLEAAAAYEIGARGIPIPEVREQLGSFRADHLRHVEDLGTVIASLGGTPIQAKKGLLGESALTALAHAAGQLGPKAALLAMISNERLTNSTYESLLELSWEEEARAVIERNFADEQRHLAWLEENREVVDFEALSASPS